MKRTERTIAVILALLMLLVAGAQFTTFSSANFFPDPGPDLPRIYIRSNGNVEPTTAPIERTGNTYKLTGDIVLYTVEIQSDNIVLDGAGYTIQGNASWMGYDAGDNGVILTGRKNVNITGLNFEGCYAGVRVIGSSDISIVGNSFTNSNVMGVVLRDSTRVLIEGNTFTDLHTDLNVPAIKVNGSSNVVRKNTLTGSTYGISIVGSSNVISDNRIEVLLPISLDRADSNIIARNNITGPPSSAHLPGQNYKGNEGIALFASCSNNLIIENNITGFINQAIRFVFNSQNNTVYGNYMADNEFAVVIQEGAVNNRFYGNTFAADSCNVSVYDVQSNVWDNGTIGNYWGDYAGADGNGDGIGDVPYKLKGFNWDTEVGGFVSAPAGQDNYPLMTPYDIEHKAVALPQTEPFPYVLVGVAAVAVAILVAVIGAGLLLIARKRRPRGRTKMKETAAIALILISLLSLGVVCVQPIKAQYERNVTINADGTVSPSTAPLEHNGNIYTVTADILASIYLYRNNTILNGAGYTVQIIEGPPSIEVNYYWQVTPIANITIVNFAVNNGYIGFNSLVNSTIANNTINGRNTYPGIGIGFTSGQCVQCSIYGNNITNARDGITVYGSNNSIFGNHIENCAIALSLRCADSEIFANYISGDTTAIELEGGSNLKIFQNYILNSNYGVWCININGQLFSGNVIYCNDFINVSENVINRAIMAPNPINGWDNGTLGNYWSDYLRNYPNATEVDSSGIGDTPYLIDAHNVDNHPLMEPFDEFYVKATTPPKISLLLPVNPVYNESSVDLLFTVDKTVNWTGYSLDGGQKVTINGNETIANIPNGVHTLTVYANDSFGNMGSKTFNFTVEVPTPFPVVPVAAAVAVAACAGLLLTFKKRGRGHKI